jgi:hypothetical protein
MATEPVGYARLVADYELDTLPLARSAVLDTAIKGRKVTPQGGAQLERFEPRYRPKATLVGHLQFALRYEGIDLAILAPLFAKAGRAELQQWLIDQPESAAARRAGYLYEWLTGKELVVKVPRRAAYVPLVDHELQFCVSTGRKDTQFRVIDNLIGNRRFCPLVRKTTFLERLIAKDLKSRTRATLAKYDGELLRRAAAFLYLKETQSSFEVERESPSPDKAQRFADLLREAEGGKPLSEERFAELQRAVVDARFHEFTYRRRQNWIGQDLGYRKKVDFVPARPEDVADLMQGLIELAERFRDQPASVDPVVAAAVISFGFVFIHPFMDGNGRLHRYLVHEILSSAGFTPKGIVLPVSAVILANLSEYVNALERFSSPVHRRTTFNPDAPDVPATGNDAVYFRYFDATEQASFLYWALERTVEHDLEDEIRFLLGFDLARTRLNAILDWPGQSVDLFIRIVRQNNGRLSKAKRASQFEWMTDSEVARCEAVVAEAFAEIGADRAPTSADSN